MSTLPPSPAPAASRPATRSPDEDIMTLRQALRMVWHHRGKIAIVTAAATAGMAVAAWLSPRTYQAEGLLQVIPVLTAENRIDNRDLFETSIISHLQRIQSAFVAERVAQRLDAASGADAGLVLRRHVDIMRPPKSDIIRIVARDASPTRAVMIVAEWIAEYFAGIHKNNIARSLNQVRTLLKAAQSDVALKEGGVRQLAERAAAVAPLITVAKVVDDQPLWQRLAGQGLSRETLQRLSDIQLKGQEENKEYTAVKSYLFNADQMLGAARTSTRFFQDVERALESKAAATNGAVTNGTATVAPVSGPSPDAAQFADTLIKDLDIIKFGEPALLEASRGLVKKTAIAFLAALVGSSLLAFLVEWFRGLED